MEMCSLYIVDTWGKNHTCWSGGAREGFMKMLLPKLKVDKHIGISTGSNIGWS